MILQIRNDYEDGHVCTEIVDVPEPVTLDADWWQEVVFPMTGCGRVGVDVEAAHVAQVVSSVRQDPPLGTLTF